MYVLIYKTIASVCITLAVGVLSYYLLTKLFILFLAAIASARESNATEMARLQSELKKIQANTEALTSRHSALDKENSKLT